jgi:hypothetical protein
MKKFLLLGMVILLMGVSTETFAQGRYNRGRWDNNRSGRWDQRSDRQRVRRGVRSGQITREEAQAIRERERQLRAERRAYRSDGVLTREERREIRRDEREQDRYIRQQRRDDERNPYYRNNRYEQRRGNGYYRRGAGSPTHPVFGRRNRH